MKKSKDESRFAVNVVIVVTVIILGSASFVYALQYIFDYDPFRPDYQYEIEMIDGDYVITLRSGGNDRSLINYCRYEFYSPSGSLIEEGSLTEIWEKNPDFMDEDFNNWTKSIVLYTDYRHSIGNGTRIIIRSEVNNGVGVANSTLKLLYWHMPYEVFLTIPLVDDIPLTKEPCPLRFGSDLPTFQYEASNETKNYTLHVVTDHLASDSLLHFPGNVCPIGITLINNSTDPLNNVSIKLYWEVGVEVNASNYSSLIEDIRIEGNEMLRFVRDFQIPQWGWNGDVMVITAEIESNEFEKPINVTTRIEVSEVTLT